MKRGGTPHLPQEVIIEEILPRLPVKSLLKFRCVAKSWCSLIESKKFMKAHLENSIKTSRFAHNPITFYTAIEFDQVRLPSLFDMPFTDPKTFKADLGIDYDPSIELVGCCNGLVSLAIDKKRFILWNPATKKFNNLPDFPIKTEDSEIEWYGFGFGFDELNDDYKVFALVWYGNNAFSENYTIVYSLRSNSWNVIQETSVQETSWSDDLAGMYVNGKLHWYKHPHEIVSFDLNCYVNGLGEIVSFDLNSYVYGVVQLPIVPIEGYIRLGVVRGCLSVHHFHNTDLDVWILKEYGVKESWDKVATVRNFSPPNSLLYPTPIAIHPNGDIFLIYGADIMIYDTKSDEFRHPNITSYDLFRDMCIYIESLASVAPDAEQAR